MPMKTIDKAKLSKFLWALASTCVFFVTLGATGDGNLAAGLPF